MTTTRPSPPWRRIACIFRPRVSQERAIEIARGECERRGRRWREPVWIMPGLSTTYCVKTNADALGCNDLIYIDKCDGTVRGFRTVPR